eukprot:1158764-Pelagomonas_calceolata.AAC.6
MSVSLHSQVMTVDDDVTSLVAVMHLIDVMPVSLHVQVMIVDDDVISLVVAEQVVRSQKWKVVKASSGEQCIDYLQHAEVGACLCVNARVDTFLWVIAHDLRGQ